MEHDFVRLDVAGFEQAQRFFGAVQRETMADIEIGIDLAARNQVQTRREGLEISARTIDVDFEVLSRRDWNGRRVRGKRPDYGDLSATLDHADWIGHGPLLEAANALDDLVETLPGGEFQSAFAQIGMFRVDGGSDTQFFRHRQAIVQDIENGNFRVHRLGDHCSTQTNGA